MRTPTPDERQAATFLIDLGDISSHEKSLLLKMARGEPMPEIAYNLQREIIARVKQQQP